MKYIAKCVLDKSILEKRRCISKGCSHLEPHELNSVSTRCIWGNECDCVPIGLEYYMKEIIKKHEEK
jgi:hypothetical protein